LVEPRLKDTPSRFVVSRRVVLSDKTHGSINKWYDSSAVVWGPAQPGAPVYDPYKDVIYAPDAVATDPAAEGIWLWWCCVLSGSV